MSATIAFIADENVDAPIVKRLRGDGHDVVSVAELAPGIDDDQVLQLANDQQRILLTSDHDFGELVFRLGRSTSGIVLLRLHGLTADRKADITSASIRAHATKLARNFTVIAPDSIRIRKP